MTSASWTTRSFPLPLALPACRSGLALTMGAPCNVKASPSASPGPVFKAMSGQALTYKLGLPAASSHRSSSRRLGFTLVELLVVVVIVGMVIALLFNSVGSVAGSARNAAVGNEIYRLDSALQSYSRKYGELPPTMLSNFTVASPAFDQDDFQKRVFVGHVHRMFPRYHGQYIEIDSAINAATTPLHPGYITQCSVSNLDAAESLVFWLGGLPQVVWATDARYEVELTGFSIDPSSPFVAKTVQPRRTEVLFDFDRRRLVDSDQDGWPEYVPDFDNADVTTPPFVYFDAGSYGFLPSYPLDWHPALAAGLDGWGFARPYLVSYTPDQTNDPEQHPRPTNFASANSFQLICAGADQRYSQLDSLTGPAINEAKNELTVYPRGQFIVRKSNTWHPIDGSQYDNLTNFIESTLQRDLGALLQ